MITVGDRFVGHFQIPKSVLFEDGILKINAKPMENVILAKVIATSVVATRDWRRYA